MYNLFLIYAPVPSYIIMVMAGIVLVLWTLGTDLYDHLEKTFFEDDDSVAFCVTHVVLSVIFTIPFLFWKDFPPVAFFYAIWTLWLCIVVLIVSVCIFFGILSCIRDWCLYKRGKN